MRRNKSFTIELVKSDVNPDKVIKQRGLKKSGRVQQYIDSECLRLSNQLAPFDEHNLIESSIINTVIGSGELKYCTRYARKLYYLPISGVNWNRSHNPQAGSFWFERMKQQYKNKILRGASRLARADAK